MDEFRLDLVFHHAGLHGFQDPEEGVGIDLGRSSDQLHFARLFDAAQLVHDRRASFVFVQRIGLLDLFGQSVFLSGDGHRGPEVFISVEVYFIGLAHQVLQQCIALVVPQHRCDPALLYGLCLTQFGSFPNGDLFIGLAHKEDLPVLFLEGIGEEKKQSLLLIDPRQIQQIPVLNEGHGAVGICRQDVVGGEQGQGARFH